jgi:hypothetical protein
MNIFRKTEQIKLLALSQRFVVALWIATLTIGSVSAAPNSFYGAIQVSGKAGDTFSIGRTLTANHIELSGPVNVWFGHTISTVALLSADNTSESTWIVPNVAGLSYGGFANIGTRAQGEMLNAARQNLLDDVIVTFGNELRKSVQVQTSTTTISIVLTPEFYSPVGTDAIENLKQSATAFLNKYAGLVSINGCTDIAAYIAAEAGVPITLDIYHAPSDNPPVSGAWSIAYRSDVNPVPNYQQILKTGDIVNTWLYGSVQHTYLVTNVQSNGKIETVDNTAAGSKIGRHLITDTLGRDVTVYRLTSNMLPTFSSFQADCLFKWGASAYPTVLSPSQSVSQSLPPYYYRYFADTKKYVGVSSADQHLYLLETSSVTDLQDLGLVSTWLKTASCQ